MLALADWLRWVLAGCIFLLIGVGGLAFLRAIGRARPQERIEPEEVADLDVFFVCGECGTEFQVTRLGQVQVPRHCGERMGVVRRPRQSPLSS